MAINSDNKVVQIIMQRDGMDSQDVIELVRDCVNELEEHAFNGNLEAAEECLSDYLGLEPDYLFELLGA